MNAMTVELTTTCIDCRYCADCGLIQCSKTCEDCDATDLDFAPECGCFEWNIEAIGEMIAEWLKSIEDDRAVIIEGTNMGWMHLSGWKFVESIEASELVNAIAGGVQDFTQHWELDEDGLKCVEYSHDAPTGATFSIREMSAAESAEYDETGEAWEAFGK